MIKGALFRVRSDNYIAYTKAKKHLKRCLYKNGARAQALIGVKITMNFVN